MAEEAARERERKMLEEQRRREEELKMVSVHFSFLPFSLTLSRHVCLSCSFPVPPTPTPTCVPL
jgi:hypothetical protein